MKKLIIVNNNMQVGGVQKSLSNLLWTLSGRYDITLLLFSRSGPGLRELPPDVKILECGSLFRYLGVSQGRCSGIHKLKRGLLALQCKLFGRPAAMKRILASQDVLPDSYDWAIAYLHNGNIKNLYGGTQEFVLEKINAGKKAAFLHCDYSRCGSDHPYNNALLSRFDRVAVCSDGCGRALLQVLPQLQDKCVTVRNCHRYEALRALARDNTVLYPADTCNVVLVARLAHEKGIHRAVQAISACGDTVHLHLVGGGPMEASIRTLVREKGLEARIHFHGEQPNPYRFMANAHLLLLTSYHEAAPMVIDEARCLGLPVLTARTTSSKEMVEDAGCGWVCDNTDEDIIRTLRELTENMTRLTERKNILAKTPAEDILPPRQVFALLED